MFTRLLFYGLLGVLLTFAYNFMMTIGINRHLINHRPGVCKEVKGIKHGSEDIVVIESQGIAFISSGLYYLFERAEEVKGQIFLFNYSDPEIKATPLPIRGFANLKTFHPHGLSHFESGGIIRLFVVNHEPPHFTHSIEVFRYDKLKKELVHEKTVKDDKFVRPNDIVALSPTSFIISNDGFAQGGLSTFFENVSGIKGGSIVYYDGQNSHFLMEHAVSPNGITLDKTKKFLLVSHVNIKQISIYRLGKDYKSIELVKDVPLSVAADNLNVDATGAVWTGAHPIMKDSIKHMQESDNLDHYGPSQVLRIEFGKDFETWEITDVYADDGRQLSASSSAAYYKNQLLMGTVFRQLVHCKIVDPAVLRSR